jgi:transcriptional regulator with XRE-family HTH domain
MKAGVGPVLVRRAPALTGPLSSKRPSWRREDLGQLVRARPAPGEAGTGPRALKVAHMPARRSSKRVTRLAQVRFWRGATQEELAKAVGTSLNTVRRLEAGQVSNPPLRVLVNCALALGVELVDVAEPEWMEWWPRPGLDGRALPEPPEQGVWWEKRRERGDRPDWLLPPPQDD